MTRDAEPVACRHCRKVQSLPFEVPHGKIRLCVHCGKSFQSHGPYVFWLSWSYCSVVAAMVLWPLAVFLPMLERAQKGDDLTYSVWQGATFFFKNNPSKESIIAGVIVFAFAIVFTPMKNLVTFWFAWIGPVSLRRSRTFKEWLLRQPRNVASFINTHFGVISMVEVSVLGIVVVTAPENQLFDYRPILGPGLVAFIGQFLFTIFAYIAYHRSCLWEPTEERS